MKKFIQVLVSSVFVLGFFAVPTLGNAQVMEVQKIDIQKYANIEELFETCGEKYDECMSTVDNLDKDSAHYQHRKNFCRGEEYICVLSQTKPPMLTQAPNAKRLFKF